MLDMFCSDQGCQLHVVIYGWVICTVHSSLGHVRGDSRARAVVFEPW